MKEKRPLILVTNDDGIHSPGLWAAVAAAGEYGDVLAAAPHTQQTGMGRAFPRTEETGIIEEVRCEKPHVRAYAVHGSPSQAVAHGVMELCGRKPDLCISGINYGENVGTTLTCSGTFGAALEAGSYGIPGIAVSVAADLEIQRSEEYRETDWEAAKSVLRVFIKRMLENVEGEEQVDVWNLNVPSQMKKPYSYRITTQSRQNYFSFAETGERDLRRPFQLKSRLYVDVETLEKDSDVYAVYVDRIISATPLRVRMEEGKAADMGAQRTLGER